MSVTFLDDATAVEHLISELARPVGRRSSGASPVLTSRGNRRRAPRVNMAASPISVQLGDETVSGVDVSLRGIQFRCASRLVPGSTVMLGLRSGQESPSMALGRVMWATFERTSADAVPMYRVGVVFETVDVRAVRNILQQCESGRTSMGGLELVQSRM